MTTLWHTPGKGYEAWETNRTWPHVNKVFNVFAFRDAEKRFTTPSQAPNQRVRSYPMSPDVGVLSRHKPQLTWFEGTYDVMAHKNGHPQFCKYPNLVTSMKNYRRDCLEPGKLTDAERAALRAEQERRETAMAQSIQDEEARKASDPKWECTQRYCSTREPTHLPKSMYSKSGSNWCYTGAKARDSRGTYHTVYSVPDSSGGAKKMSCATNQQVAYQSAQVVRGIGALGESQYEREAMSKQVKSYRTTELALAGVFLAGLYLVMKS